MLVECYAGTIGLNAGGYNTTGYDNTFLGLQAGFSNSTAPYNTFLGASAGYANTTRANNTFLGNEAGFNNTVLTRLCSSNRGPSPELQTQVQRLKSGQMKMPEADGSLRLAFRLLDRRIAKGRLELAIDGAQVQVLDTVHFSSGTAISFMSLNSWPNNPRGSNPTDGKKS